MLGAALFIILILGLTSFANYVIQGSQDYNFDSVAKNVKQEMIRVVNHDISNDENNIEDFIGRVAVYLEASYPDASFLFILGNESSVTFMNYADSDENLIEVEGVVFASPVNGLSQTLNNPVVDQYIIKLNGVDHVAEIYPSTQVYFAIEQVEKNEAFVGFA